MMVTGVYMDKRGELGMGKGRRNELGEKGKEAMGIRRQGRNGMYISLYTNR